MIEHSALRAEVMSSSFVIPVVKSWLVYSPLHRVLGLVNGSAVEALVRNAQDSHIVRNYLDVAGIDTAGPPRAREGELRPEFMGLVVTRQCNLQCVYCGFGSERALDTAMGPRLALGAVDWMAEYAHRLGLGRMDVHFFGGEPSCAQNVVDVAVHRARARAQEYGLLSRFELDTNGHFSSEYSRFIGDYFDTVVLSIDGPEDLQNRYRPTRGGGGSFARVAGNAKLLGKYPVELCLRACVTSENVALLPSLAQWFCTEFRPAMIDFEPLRPTPQSNELNLAPPEPRAFASSFLKAYALAAQLGVTVTTSSTAVDRLQHSSCPVGKDAIIISPEGRVSACYLQEKDCRASNLDLNFGHTDQEGRISLDSHRIENIRRIAACKVRCDKCFARWHCAGGCCVANFEANQSACYDDSCIYTRIISLCLLLIELGESQLVEQLLNDDVSLGKLSRSGSDRLLDWSRNA